MSDVDSDMILSETMCRQGKGKVAVLSLADDLTAQLFQGRQKRCHGASAHLLRGIHMENTFGDTQSSRQKTGSGSGTADVQGRLGAGNLPTQSFYRDDAGILIHSSPESEILYALQKMSGIIGEQYPPQRGCPLRQHGQQEAAVGNTLGTRHPDRQRFCCFFHFLIYSRNAVNFVCHGSVYPF